VDSLVNQIDADSAIALVLASLKEQQSKVHGSSLENENEEAWD